MSSDQQQRQQNVSNWVLQIYANGKPLMLTEFGYNVTHAKKRMHGSLRHKNLNEIYFPGSAEPAIPKNATIYVWNGYWDDNNEKVFVQVDSLEEAVNQGWFQCARGTLLFA